MAHPPTIRILAALFTACLIPTLGPTLGWSAPSPAVDRATPRFEHAALPDEQGRKVVDVYGDWSIDVPRRDTKTHFRVHGNVYLSESGHWTLENSALTLMGEHARQYRVYWQGGRLTTRDCVVGGFHAKNRTAQCNFEVDDGLWDATDTTVQYCYAVSVGGHGEHRGELRGLRFLAGESPDAIIVSGDGIVTLRESRYPIALGLHVGDGGEAVLDLPTNTPLTRTIDAADWLNGSARYVVDLRETTVPHWFLFVRDLSPEAPPATITVDRCENFLLSLLGRDWRGTVDLTPDLSLPLKVNNTTVTRGSGEVGLRMYGGLYFSGENDVTITGEGVVAETMCWGGVVRFDGGREENLLLKCTTMDCRGGGRIELARLRLGGGTAGQIIAEGDGAIVGDIVEMSSLLLRTEGSGSIQLTEANLLGQLRIQSHGGEVLIRPKSADPKHKPAE